jgi:hypothetical protein
VEAVLTGADTLLVLHLLAAMAMVGSMLAVLALSLAGRPETPPAYALRRLAARIAWLVVILAGATVAFGEGAKAREAVSGTWLDVGIGLGYGGSLLPSIALVFLARRTVARPELSRWTSVVALLMTVVGLTTAFVMSARPG